VVFESGWTSLGDKPEGFAAQPPAEKYLEQLPTAWDETRLVSGSPDVQAAGDRQVVIARRSDDRWFIGGILAGQADTMIAPLAFLGKGSWLLETVGDSGGALQRTVRTVTARDTLTVDAAADGGSPRSRARPPGDAPTATSRSSPPRPPR
jgi:hypothetical protein